MTTPVIIVRGLHVVRGGTKVLEDFDLDNRFHSQLAEASVKFSYTFRF